MRIANLSDRLVLIVDGGAIDVETASGGRFDADPQAVYERWDEFREWASTVDEEPVPFAPQQLQAPAPRPAQIFAIGSNYREHVEEGGTSELPDWPLIFTKFSSSIAGPYDQIELPTGAVDWEVELVFVVGRLARNVPSERAWDHVAGLTVGQDLSEREVQLRGAMPQMSMGKSLPGFSPMGPYLVTPDAFADPDDLEIGCALDGEVLQHARTKDMIVSIPAIVEILSGLLPLLPGDVVFTGTMGGVGVARNPARFLRPGEELVSTVEGIGEMRHTFRSDRTLAELGQDAAKAESIVRALIGSEQDD